jgi:hypothetical protein
MPRFGFTPGHGWPGRGITERDVAPGMAFVSPDASAPRFGFTPGHGWPGRGVIERDVASGMAALNTKAARASHWLDGPGRH